MPGQAFRALSPQHTSPFQQSLPRPSSGQALALQKLAEDERPAVREDIPAPTPARCLEILL